MPANRPLTSLIGPNRVRVGLGVDTKEELLEAMVELAGSDASVSDPEQVLADVRAREARMSTGVGDGLALPHARTAGATETVLALATLAEPLGYAALDGQPVRLVVLLVGPEADRVAHLHVLGRVSRVLSDAVVRTKIEEARSAEEVLEAIRGAEAVLA